MACSMIRVRFEVAHPDGPTEDVEMLAVPRRGDGVMFGDDEYEVGHVRWLIGDDDLDVFVSLKE